MVLTNPQRIISLYMLKIRKRHPIPSLVSLVLKTLKKASRVSVKNFSTPSTRRYALIKPTWGWNYDVIVF
jgi:hypothetical protein